MGSGGSPHGLACSESPSVLSPHSPPLLTESQKAVRLAHFPNGEVDAGRHSSPMVAHLVQMLPPYLMTREES